MSPATVESDVTAYIGGGTIGIRYSDRVLCFDCSVKLDTRNLDLTLEQLEDHSTTCASCQREI